jgi:hypothetical protein
MNISRTKIAFFVLIIPTVIFGNIIEVEVTGVVDSVFVRDGFELDDSVVEGTNMTGTFVYDTDAVQNPNGDFTVISIEISVGNYYFSVSDSGDCIFRINQETNDGYYHIETYDGSYEGVIYDYGVQKLFSDIDWYITDIYLRMSTTNLEYHSGDDLPTWFPDISAFDDYRGFTLKFYEEYEWFPDDTYTVGGFTISGELTSIQIIPEPATILLLGLGALAVVKRKK